MTKRAVVVGINDYSVQGFGNLGGCVRDADAMYHTLIDAFSFDPAQVYLYKDATASSSNILRCLNYVLRISEPGDVVCFYYAGHGGLHPSGTAGTFYQTIIPHSGRFITDWDLWQAADQLQPSWVNFSALLTKLLSICDKRMASTLSTGRIRASITLLKIRPFSLALARKAFLTPSTMYTIDAGCGWISSLPASILE